MGTGTPGTLRLWAATAAVSVAALVLGLVGYHGYVGSPAAAWPAFAASGPFDLLYYTLQLFVLGASPFGGPPYGGPLSLAMYLAPLATVLAVVATVSAAFRERLAAWRVSRRTGNTVVVGTPPGALILAQRLAQPDDSEPRATRWQTWCAWLLGTPLSTVVLVGAAIDRDSVRQHRIRVVTGDPVDEGTLRRAGVPGAVRVFALDGSGAVNAAVALQVRELHTLRVEVFARVENPELNAAMRARRLGVEGDRGVRLDFFSLRRIAAVALLDKHAPHADAVVVGSDEFAEAVHRELVRRRRQAGEPAPGPLVPCAEADTLGASAATTYVCEDDPDEVLRIGLRLLLAGRRTVVLCLGRRSALAGAVEPRLFDAVLGQLQVFGMLDTACDPRLLTSNALTEQLARALHAGYLEDFGRPPTQESHKPWEKLAETYKADNRRHAEEIGDKLALIRAIIVPASSNLPPFTLDPDEVEDLAQKEHERWMRGRRQAGVGYGLNRTDTTHPDMLPWRKLDPEVQEKDRSFIRTLPDLLAGEDLAIVRRAGL